MTWQVVWLRHWGARSCAALAAAGFLVILLSLARVSQVPSLVIVGLLALSVVSALRPERALAALAAGVPVASWLGRPWNTSVAWPETLVVAFCAGYCLRGAIANRRSTGAPADGLAPPLFLAIGVVIASLAVQLFIDAWRFGEAATRRDLWDLIRSGYFVTAMSGDPIDAAMRLLESLVLLKAASTAARQIPDLGPRLVGWAVGGAAFAAALNLARLWEAAARLESPLTALIPYFMSQRLNIHYPDLNAAGSYFVLALFPALGLSLTRRGRACWIAVLLIASSIWISGSRTAMTGAVLAMTLPAAALGMTIRRGRSRWIAVAGTAAMLLLAAGAAAHFSPERGNQQPALAAIEVRLEMIRTSLKMTASSPSFGIGVGRYYSRSGEFSSPELLRLFPPAIHENAHNNFLQLLAELGIVGFAAILWLLWTATRASAAILAADRRNPIRWGLVTGLAAFVLSWLGGHPLLIDEPAFTFWLLLGVASGWGALAAPPSTPSVRTPWIVGILIAVVAISVPVRVVAQRADFDLEHRGIGLSPWQSGVDGVRYRLAGATSSVFVPSSAQALVIPLRAQGSAPERRVEIRLDGRPGDVVTVASDRWLFLRLRMLPDREAPRFRRLELRTAPESGDAPVLMIGKVEAR
jgi:O-Antigen ligase